MSRLTLQARWTLPVEVPPLENGRVTVESGRIASIERGRAGDRADFDFGDAVLLPGLINAHTHMELSSLHGQVPPGEKFTDWIVRLSMLHPRRRDDLAALAAALGAGARQSLAAGVTTVADISAGQPAISEWTRSGLNVVGFLEVFGMGPKRLTGHEEHINLLESVLPAAKDEAQARRELRLGFSPHAPYSVDAPVYRTLVDHAGRTRRPLCTHLAETREEHQFLRYGSGPFRELLERFGLWDGSFEPPGCTPVEYAAQLGLLACRALLAHANYVNDDDIALLARSRANVVYCPRSHRFFGHEPHRYKEMLERGVNVCIGTDSLASNDSLSVLEELRFLRRHDPAISNEQLLTMATINAARALDLPAGSLSPGRRADLVVLPLQDHGTRDPLEDLLRSATCPRAVFVGAEAATLGETAAV